MNLGQLRNYIKSFPEGHTFNYSLSEPFSWRGDYVEVAFSIEDTQSTREDLLKKINKALTETFHGWKGGEYRHYEHTNIHFEGGRGDYSDGEYTEKWISKLLNTREADSPEHRLVGLLFEDND